MSFSLCFCYMLFLETNAISSVLSSTHAHSFSCHVNVVRREKRNNDWCNWVRPTILCVVELIIHEFNGRRSWSSSKTAIHCITLVKMSLHLIIEHIFDDERKEIFEISNLTDSFRLKKIKNKSVPATVSPFRWEHNFCETINCLRLCSGIIIYWSGSDTI